MKLAAVIILYHPKKEILLNIKTYYDYVDRIFVFDNTETKALVQDDLSKLSKVTLHYDTENKGIAKRLNDSCKIAIEEHFDWILTMDQDTSFSDNIFSNYLNCFQQYKDKEKVAMFGTRFLKENLETTNDCSSVKNEKLITSGSLLNLSLFTTIGGFDEQLFIDAVDYDYCFRAQMAGYFTVQFLNICSDHKVGNEVYRSSIKTIFLLKKKKQVHSPLRCYYMYRNMLYLKEKYHAQDKNYSKQISNYVLSRIKVSVLYGRNTLEIIRHLKFAKDDFKNGKMGKKEAI